MKQTMILMCFQEMILNLYWFMTVLNISSGTELVVSDETRPTTLSIEINFIKG
jgi:hypothetical protein